MQSYSQLGQDVQALERFKEDEKAYFVDVGAHDGITLSNTYLLEQNGWTGLCIEPNPALFEELSRNRLGSNCVKAAAFSESGKEFEFRDAGLLGGITDYISTYREHTKDASTFQILSRTLDDILSEFNAPKYIQYLSIDTEGTELEILKGIDFSKYQFGLISIEHNYEEPKRSTMQQFLRERGYQRHRENQWDDDYIPTLKKQNKTSDSIPSIAVTRRDWRPQLWVA